MKDIMTGNEAAAWGARLAEVDYVPIYPITPQTEIVEKIASWAASGQMKARVTPMESEHSMLTAAGLASLSGARVFTWHSSSRSQGLTFGQRHGLHAVSCRDRPRCPGFHLGGI